MLFLCFLIFLNQLLLILKQKKWGLVLAVINLIVFAALFYSHARFPLFVRL